MTSLNFLVIREGELVMPDARSVIFSQASGGRMNVSNVKSMTAKAGMMRLNV